VNLHNVLSLTGFYVVFQKISNTRTLIILPRKCHQVARAKVYSLWRSGEDCITWYTMLFL